MSTSRLHALPVKGGEAFLLSTTFQEKEYSVVVDGGKRGLLKEIIGAEPDLRHIDVVICTHSDADHSHGLAKFPAHWLTASRTIGEFWLPGAWAAALPDALSDPEGFADRLLRGAIEVAKLLDELTPEVRRADGGIEGSLRKIAGRSHDGEFARNRLKDKNVRDTNKRDDQTEQQDIVSKRLGLSGDDARRVVRQIEENDFTPSKRFRSYMTGLRWHYPVWYEYDSWLGAVIVAAIETAKEILAIAETSLVNEIPIRWFDFKEFEKGYAPFISIESPLRPLNAVELAAPPTVRDRELLESLFLSRQNVESLAFQRIEEKSEPSVVFLGDSRLAFGLDKPVADFEPWGWNKVTKPPLITAPHHGSRVNDRAYEVLSDWLKKDGLDGITSVLVVRNGGMWKQKLNRFATINTDLRRCAKCPQRCHGGSWERRVSAQSSGLDWGWSGAPSACGSQAPHPF
jgi:hypothetical protein